MDYIPTVIIALILTVGLIFLQEELEEKQLTIISQEKIIREMSFEIQSLRLSLAGQLNIEL
jgi:hypothetical protein